MNAESKGVCQRCNENFIFPTEMQGQDIDCPHCGKQTTLVVSSQPANKEQRSLLTDPNWDDRLPKGPVQTIGKGAKTIFELIVGVVGLVFFGAIFIILFIEFMRFLHFAWGH